VIQQLSHSAQLHCIQQGLHMSPKKSGQLTSLANQPDPATQSNSSENVDGEM